MANKLLLIGGGGHCKSVLDSILITKQYESIGIIDKELKVGSEIMGFKVVGKDEDLERFYNEGFNEAFISLGSIGNWSVRSRISELLKSIGFSIPSIIDPSAIISEHALIGEGVFIGKSAVVNSGAFIGSHAIINTGAIVEHDCHIGEFVHVATGALLCGEVHICKGTHIGAGSVVRQQIKVGENCLVGVGSTVVKNINSNTVAYGNPCMEKEQK